MCICAQRSVSPTKTQITIDKGQPMASVNSFLEVIMFTISGGVPHDRQNITWTRYFFFARVSCIVAYCLMLIESVCTTDINPGG